MIYQAIDGTVLAVTQSFLDEAESPLIPSTGYPKVRLQTTDKKLISSVSASASGTPGTWNGNLTIPNLKLTERKEYVVRWVMRTVDGEVYEYRDVVIIAPKIDTRSSDVVIVEDDEEFSFTIPSPVLASFTGKCSIYSGNNLVYTTEIDQNSDLHKTIDTTTITIPIPADFEVVPSLVAYLLTAAVKPAGGKRNLYSFKFWMTTPQIMLGMSHLEDYLNKSRIENTIPELRYTTTDLLTYLERGLYLFNRVAYPTSFTGTNMQGSLFDAWLLCSQYYALSAQLLAEGSLSFNFNGQGISVDVDRIPSLESALGRVESQIESQVGPLKKQLNKNAITTGDGSVGATNLRNVNSVGTLSLINAATTKFPGRNGLFLGRRPRSGAGI